MKKPRNPRSKRNLKASSPRQDLRDEKPRKISHREVATPTAKPGRTGLAIQEGTSPRIVQNMLEAALHGDPTQAHMVFNRMEDTWPRLLSNNGELRNAATTAQFTLRPYAEDESEPTPAAIEKADLVNRCFKNWKGDLRRNINGYRAFMFDITDAIGKGVSVQELIWDFIDGEWRPVGSFYTDASFYRMNREHTELGLINSNLGPSWTPFPENRFVVSAYKNRSGNLLGYGLFRSIAWWWAVGIFGRQWLARNAELFGLPSRVAKAHKNASGEEKSAILSDLQSMGSSLCAVLPDGAEVELLEASRSAGESPQKLLLDMRDKALDILLLGQTLTTDVGDSGSRALGSVHNAVRQDRLEIAANWVAETINTQLVPAILELNYGETSEAPELVLDLAENSDPMVDIQRDEIASQIVDIPKAWFYERHNIPMPQDGEEIITVRQQQQADPFGGGSLFASQGRRRLNGNGTERIDPHDQMMNFVLENLTNVSAEYLEPIKPALGQVMALIQSPNASDQQVIKAIETMVDEMPELFGQMNHEALASALQEAMGAATINGSFNRMASIPGVPQKFREQGS